MPDDREGRYAELPVGRFAFTTSRRRQDDSPAPEVEWTAATEALQVAGDDARRARRRGGDTMSSAQRHDREDPIDAMPGAAAFEDVYHRLLELAADELHRPVSTTIDTWEDGTFRIRVYHHIAGAGERETLYYHSDEGVVRYGIEGGDRLKDERVVTTIEPPAGSTTR